MTRLINIADMGGPEWDFVRRFYDDPGDDWSFHVKTRGATLLERAVPRPDLARYGNALRAALSAPRGADALLISHLPRATLAAEIARRALRPGFRHIAFAFNFTDLPTGIRRGLMRRYFRTVDRFITFSRHEIGLYADQFALPEDRFTFVPWCMTTPHHDRRETPPYVSAVGGEGRDYDTVLAAARARPDQRFHIVTRPGRVAAERLPPNVALTTDATVREFWSIVANSRACIVSLDSENRCNGHISVVGAMRLGVPVIATSAPGLADYIAPDRTALTIPVRDAEALAAAIDRLDDTGLRARLAAEARAFADAECDERRWAALIHELAHPVD